MNCRICNGLGQVKTRVDVAVPVEIAFNLIACPDCKPNYLGRRVDVEGVGTGEVISQSYDNVTIAIDGESCKVVIASKASLEPVECKE